MSPDDEKALVELLAHIYGRIPWGRMHTSKNAWDIWNHRVRAAACRGNINEFASRLCNYFGLQYLVPEAVELCEKLRPNEREVLDTLYAEHIPLAMKGVIRAREMKEQRRSGGQQTLEVT